jgi:hypothetical protein
MAASVAMIPRSLLLFPFFILLKFCLLSFCVQNLFD